MLLNEKYRAIGIGTLFVNFLVQRVFCVNRNFKYMLHYTSRVNCPTKINIVGDKKKSSCLISFATSLGCYFQAKNGIIIHEGVIFAPGVKVISANHDMDNYNHHVKELPVILNKNVWIGANVVILPGVEIGESSIIGAGSVVTKSMPANSVCAGVPCKKIRSLHES